MFEGVGVMLAEAVDVGVVVGVCVAVGVSVGVSPVRSSIVACLEKATPQPFDPPASSLHQTFTSL